MFSIPTLAALRNSTDESSDARKISGKADPSEVYRLLSEKSISYNLNPGGAKKQPQQTMNKNKTRIFVMRHGERVDFTFGSNWLSYCWENGKYVQPDLNMPKELPSRSNEPQVRNKIEIIAGTIVNMAETKSYFHRAGKMTLRSRIWDCSRRD